jgi:hypothetical protein
MGEEIRFAQTEKLEILHDRIPSAITKKQLKDTCMSLGGGDVAEFGGDSCMGTWCLRGLAQDPDKVPRAWSMAMANSAPFPTYFLFIVYTDVGLVPNFQFFNFQAKTCSTPRTSYHY